ncbi:MAG: amidohydrolase family protein [Anaerolineae bacterium]|nr:MAG: amidohydrolase family protein [Anaerolineae bacterium]
MIIDADTHISPTGGEFTLEAHLLRMEKAGIDRTVTWLKPDYDGQEIEGHNAYVYQATRQHPDQILGFGWADPTVGVDHAKDMVKKCIYDYGFHGVKLNGAQNNYYIDDPELSLPVVAEIARTGKPIAFHIGPDAYERTHPFRAAKIARLYPEMKVLMVHMGMRNADMNGAVIEMARENPNMVLVGSGTSSRAILKAIQALGAGRVCFGTDAPFEMMHVVLAAYNALLDGAVSAAEKASVMGGNIARLFRL